jgi:hypothetical protein
VRRRRGGLARRPVELRLIEQPESRRERVRVAGVVEVHVGKRHVRHVARAQAQRLQLLGERHADARRDAVFAATALVLRELVTETRIPEQRALRVTDDEAGRDERAGLPSYSPCRQRNPGP